jgi:endoribonuclease Dicer
MHTDLNVGMYWGDMGIDFSHAATWKQEIDKHEVSRVEAASLIIRLFFLSLFFFVIICIC